MKKKLTIKTCEKLTVGSTWDSGVGMSCMQTTMGFCSTVQSLITATKIGT